MRKTKRNKYIRTNIERERQEMREYRENIERGKKRETNG